MRTATLFLAISFLVINGDCAELLSESNDNPIVLKRIFIRTTQEICPQVEILDQKTTAYTVWNKSLWGNFSFPSSCTISDTISSFRKALNTHFIVIDLPELVYIYKSEEEANEKKKIIQDVKTFDKRYKLTVADDMTRMKFIVSYHLPYPLLFDIDDFIDEDRKPSEYNLLLSHYYKGIDKDGNLKLIYLNEKVGNHFEVDNTIDINEIDPVYEKNFLR